MMPAASLSETYRACRRVNDRARRSHLALLPDVAPRRPPEIREAADMIQERIRETPELAFFWNSTPTGMLLLDGNGTIIAANHAIASFLGYTESEMVGLHFSKITSGQDRDADVVEFQKLVDQKIHEYTMHKLFRPKLGAPRPGRAHAMRTPFEHPTGVVVYTSVLPMDPFEAAGVTPEERQQVLFAAIGELFWKHWKVWLPILLAIGGVANAGRIIDMITG